MRVESADEVDEVQLHKEKEDVTASSQKRGRDTDASPIKQWPGHQCVPDKACGSVKGNK